MGKFERSLETQKTFTPEQEATLTYSSDLAEALLRARSPEQQLVAIRVLLQWVHDHCPGVDWRVIYEEALAMEPPHFPPPPPQDVAPIDRARGKQVHGD
jgi:hypothetical protein